MGKEAVVNEVVEQELVENANEVVENNIEVGNLNEINEQDFLNDGFVQPFVDDVNEMAKEEKKEILIDPYDFDSLFSNLSTDVSKSNRAIDDLNEKRKELEKKEERFLEEREEFENRHATLVEELDNEKKSFEEERNKTNAFLESEKEKLALDQDDFHKEVETIKEKFNNIQEVQNKRNDDIRNREVQFEKYKHEQTEMLESEKEKLLKDVERFKKIMDNFNQTVSKVTEE